MPERINVEAVEVPQSRIPSVPVVRAAPPPVRPPKPIVRQIQPPVIPVPGYVPPTYEPPNYTTTPSPSVPTNTQRPPQEPDWDQIREYSGNLNLPTGPFGGPREVNQGTVVELWGNEIPVPTGKEVTLAGTTAVASVSAALLGKSIVEKLIKIMKPVAKQVIIKVKQKIGKDLSVQEAQLYFAFENGGLKKVLKAEQKADLIEQRRLRQRRYRRKESQDET